MRCPRPISEFIVLKLLIILALGIFSNPLLAQDNKKAAIDSTIKISADTLRTDSLRTDSLTCDSLQKKNVRISKNAIKSDVKYLAKDSISFDLSSKTVKMYNTSQVNYETIELKSAYIKYGFTDSKVHATSLKDTGNADYGKPEFKDGDQSYDSDTIRYNFKTKKGFIRGVYTKMQDDGHLYARIVKKDSNDIMWAKDGKFCPCIDKDAATLINVKKIKIIPKDKIITGAGYMSVYGIPVPLAFPFGFFPNSNKQSAGIVIPSQGESAQLGFFLLNGGYYQPIGEKADVLLTGDIYSKGSYGFTGVSRYKSNYRHNGDLNVKYNVVKNSYSGFPDYSESKNFFVRWNHVQDPKARPNTSFSANVNVGSSSAFRNNFNSSLTDFVSNSFNSGINYGKSWSGKPYSLTASINHSQNTQSRTFSVTLPNVAFNLQRVNLPLGFLKSKSDGRQRWFEKIGFNLGSQFGNQLNTLEPQVRLNNLNYLGKEFRKGLNHSASLSTSLKAFHLSINPRVNYNEKWHFERLRKFYNAESGVPDTAIDYGFYRTHDYNFDLNFSTQLYGMFTAKKGPIAAIRHMMTPSASIYYRPPFNYWDKGNFGAFGALDSIDPYQRSLYGQSRIQQSGGLSLSLNNNLEMKVRTPKDTVAQTRKFTLLDSYSISSQYDIFKDSVKWSPVNMQARTQLFKAINLTYNGTYTPYNYNEVTGATYNESLLKARGKLLRMLNTQMSVGVTLGHIEDQAAGKRKKGEKLKLSHILPSGIPVTTNINYTVTIMRLFQNGKDTLITTQSLNGSGEIQLLRTVKFSYTTGWDFILKELTPTMLNFYWDLNCWEMAGTIIPFGTRKSYQIRLNMKSTLFKDLKLQKRKNLSDANLIY